MKKVKKILYWSIVVILWMIGLVPGTAFGFWAYMDSPETHPVVIGLAAMAVETVFMIGLAYTISKIGEWRLEHK